ncbi:hypothetical protein VSDG_07592 [Cytospora chrysosperma]|uniref:Uncharacterized protein n=1 Tax=Cytospora chrysosperma TaxID=252740 RepID=A0A423VM04_CYTCH|nr:hypothetical protein VSDG_07592 [Valsa sordida]
MRFFQTTLARLALLVGSATALVPRDTVKSAAACAPGTELIVNETTVNGVHIGQGACQTAESVLQSRNAVNDLDQRNTNLCGAPCTTYCNSGTGGPDPNDCSSLASSIEGSGGFTMSAGYTYYWWWGSCEAYIINTSSADEYYCYDESNFAGVINYLAWNCQASTSGGPYSGGSCHFYDNTQIGWVQVQTS